MGSPDGLALFWGPPFLLKHCGVQGYSLEHMAGG